MVALPFAVSMVLAILVAPVVVGGLRQRRLTAPNYRGASLPRPTGLVLLAAPLLALGLLVPVERLSGAEVFAPGTARAVGFVAGVALLGLLDDLVGGGADAPRGLRAHLAQLARGRPSTGAVKAAGTAALALYVLSSARLGPVAYLLGAATLTLAPHLFNLLDLRPGRSIKALLLLGAGLTLGARELEPLWTLGLFLAPILVLLPLDLRERGMLGDTGASAVGAVAGLWLTFTLSPPGQAIAVAVVAAIVLYGELRSIGALVERTPGLRQLDSLGRCG